jgi:hypothetical protein
VRIYGLRPLSRLEAAIYGLIVALLVALLAERLLDYMEIAERAAVEQTVLRVNSGLNLRLAHALIQGRRPELPANQDPFTLAGVVSPNFLGAQDFPDLQGETRAWVYDRLRQELIYVPRLKAGLRTDDPDGVLRFRVAADPAGGAYSLVPVTRYAWNLD